LFCYGDYCHLHGETFSLEIIEAQAKKAHDFALELDTYFTSELAAIEKGISSEDMAIESLPKL